MVVAARETQTLHMNEDNLIRFNRVRLESTGAFINSGTGTWSLKGPTGTELGTGSLAYVASSNGKWHGTINKAVVYDVALGGTLVDGDECTLEVTFDNGGGADAFRKVDLIATYHSGED